MARITVEDCLAHENNRFALVLLASKRAKQLLTGHQPVADQQGNKCIVGALREIAASQVRFMTAEEEAEWLRQKEEEAKLAAMQPAPAPIMPMAVAAPVSSGGDDSATDDEVSENGNNGVGGAQPM